MNLADYKQLLKRLLPPGRAWLADAGSFLDSLLQGLAGEFVRVENRGIQGLDEADPRYMNEMFEQWESALDLPDPCVTADQSLEQRRDAIISKYTGIGGQSKQYFIDLAADLGYVITIDEFFPWTCEDACTGGIYEDDVRFYWQMNAPLDNFQEATCMSPCTDPLRSWGNEALECRLNDLKPAHTIAVFSYT